jgi:hypothetical protein
MKQNSLFIDLNISPRTIGRMPLVKQLMAMLLILMNTSKKNDNEK